MSCKQLALPYLFTGDVMKSKIYAPFIIASWLLVTLLIGLNHVRADSDKPEAQESVGGEQTEIVKQPGHSAASERQGGYVAWDESVDGDLSSWPLTPTVVSFQGGLNIVRGTVGGPPGDGNEGYDVWTFNVPPGTTMPEIALTNYVVTGGNTSTGFNLHDGAQGTAGPQLVFVAMGIGDVNVTNLISDAAPLPSGDYSIALLEFTAPGQIYES